MKLFIVNKKQLSLVSILTALVLITSQAFASIGTVLYSYGNVTVEKPSISTLKRGARLDEGDTVVTGAKAYVQLKLDDGTKVAIKPGSRFTIESLEAPATATKLAIGKGTKLSASFNLQKGGFRTITGRISKRDPSAYQLTTPTAVIRVRGTNYVAQICAADCAGTDDGLYVGVSDGGISMENAGGTLELSDGDYGYAATFNTPPSPLLAPPSTLSEGETSLAEEEEGESEEGEGEGKAPAPGAKPGGEKSGDEAGDDKPAANTVAGRNPAPPPPPPAPGAENDASAPQTPPDQPITDDSGDDLTGGTKSFVARAMTFSFGSEALGIDANNETIAFDANGALSSFEPKSGTSDTAKFDIGSGTNKNVGTDSITGLKWGRWSAGTSTGDAAGTDLTSQSLHWVASSSTDTVPTQVITGSATYTLVGNTDPTDNQGNVGVLGSASFSADFTNATVNSSVQLGINDQVWSATGDGAITKHLFNGQYGSVTVNGDSSGTGSFGGTFGGFNGANTPAGAGLSYQLNNGSTTVNGSAVFNNAGSNQQ